MNVLNEIFFYLMLPAVVLFICPRICRTVLFVRSSIVLKEVTKTEGGTQRVVTGWCQKCYV